MVVRCMYELWMVEDHSAMDLQKQKAEKAILPPGRVWFWDQSLKMPEFIPVNQNLLSRVDSEFFLLPSEDKSSVKKENFDRHVFIVR